MQRPTDQPRTLVIGGAGKSGRGVADRLVAAGRPVRLELFTGILDGRNGHVAHGVQQALGRPARDFGDDARRTAAAGAGDLEAATVAPAAGPAEAGR